MTHNPTRPRAVHAAKLAALAAAALLACAAARAAPLDDIRRFVEAAQFEQAWALGQANPQLIGDVHFDFPYGVAAISTGHVAEGLLALERHLAAVPGNDRARLELARGYFLLGEYGRARAEFEVVLRYNPPAGVRASIQTYLQTMQAREGQSQRAGARLYVEAGLAHDNNVNLGTYHDQVTVLGSEISLEGSPSRQRRDEQFLAAFGIGRTYRVTNRFSAVAGLDFDHRENRHAREFNLTNGNGYIGFTQLSGLALWRATVGLGELMVAGRRYRDTLSVDGEAEIGASAGTTFTLFTRYAEFRQAQPDDKRDVNASTLGATVTWRPEGAPGSPSLGLRGSYTSEHSVAFRPDLSHDSAFARVFASVAPSDRLLVSGGLSFRHDRYGADEPLVAPPLRRRDLWLNADLLAVWNIDANWSLRGEASWTINRSNDALFEYGHKMAALKLRYQY